MTNTVLFPTLSLFFTFSLFLVLASHHVSSHSPRHVLKTLDKVLLEGGVVFLDLAFLQLLYQLGVVVFPAYRHLLQVRVDCEVISFDLSIRGGQLKVLKLAVVVQSLAHEVTVAGFFVFEWRKLGVYTAHQSLHVVIFSHFERIHCQCLIAIPRGLLSQSKRVWTAIELNLHEAADAMVHAVLGLSITRQHTVA